ncbi:MAG: hypothetical protein ABI068_06220 [Ktedonobacterales bacterium]
MDVIGNDQVMAGRPACAIQHQHDLLVRPRFHFRRKGGEFRGEQVGADPGRQMPDRAP